MAEITDLNKKLHYFLDCIDDAVADLLYYDRKECEELVLTRA